MATDRSTEAIELAAVRSTLWSEVASSRDAAVAAVAVAREVQEQSLEPLRQADLVVFSGAGSSFYLADTSAWAFRELTGRPAIATPLSEILLRAEAVFPARRRDRQPVVVISRSGLTSEALMVVRRCRAEGRPTIAVTCRPDSDLAADASLALASPLGNERSIVMTRSFVSMLALVLRMVARVAAHHGLARDLDELGDQWPDGNSPNPGWSVAGAKEWSRVVALGGGPAYGVASETCLKLIEMSRIPAMPFRPLEFRHGPISMCEPGVLVITLADGPGAEEEAAVAAECAQLGATPWFVGRNDGAPTLASMPSARERHHLARLVSLLPSLYGLAFGVAVLRGLDPAKPRHLSQVVLLS